MKDGSDGKDAARSSGERGEDRTEMKKEAKLSRRTLLNGSAWSTEKMYMKKGKMRYLFWDRAHAEKEGNGGAVQ